MINVSASSTVQQSAGQREAERRASYAAQLRRAADLIEQFELPTGTATINAPIVCLPDDESDAILTAVAERTGVPVNRSTPSQPGVTLDLGDGGTYYIYYSSTARIAAYNKANEAMEGWDKGLDDTPAVTDRDGIGTDGCGCPVTAEHRPDGSWIEGTERTEHRSGCWAVTE